MKLDIEEIKKLIPHRHPFLFLDWCDIIEPGKEGIGFKKFLSDEYFFKGHFPGTPIVPGVILIEALAQTAGIVVSFNLSHLTNRSVLFMSVSSAKFRKPVMPNEEITFNVNFLNNIKSVYKFHGEAKNSTVKVCEAVFSAMIINKDSKEIF